MRVVQKIIDLDSRTEKDWRLIPIGDIHIGNRNCDIPLLQRIVDRVRDDERALWIGMGDYSDSITCKDKRYDLNSIDSRFATPDVQYRKIEEIFRPIKDKCIGLLDGNHDYLQWLEHSHNYVDTMAYNMGVPYLTMDAYVRLSVRRHYGEGKTAGAKNIEFYAHHGWSNARTNGSKVNRIEDLAGIFPNLDLYLMGHVHLLGNSPSRFQLAVDKSMKIVQKKEHFVFTGSFLKGYVDGTVSYVERKAYQPTALGSPCIKMILGYGKDHNENRLEVSEMSS
jgi:hypothetical protein